MQIIVTYSDGAEAINGCLALADMGKLKGTASEYLATQRLNNGNIAVKPLERENATITNIQILGE